MRSGVPAKRPASRSELQSVFPGGVGQRLDPPVILEAAAIEADGLNSGLLRPLGDEASHRLGGFRLGAGGPFLLRGSSGERVAGQVIDDLDVNVLVGAIDAQA